MSVSKKRRRKRGELGDGVDITAFGNKVLDTTEVALEDSLMEGRFTMAGADVDICATGDETVAGLVELATLVPGRLMSGEIVEWRSAVFGLAVDLQLGLTEELHDDGHVGDAAGDVQRRPVFLIDGVHVWILLEDRAHKLNVLLCDSSVQGRLQQSVTLIDVYVRGLQYLLQLAGIAGFYRSVQHVGWALGLEGLERRKREGCICCGLLSVECEGLFFRFFSRCVWLCDSSRGRKKWSEDERTKDKERRWGEGDWMKERKKKTKQKGRRALALC